jgi:predicted RNase H-like HicB family nuclease
MRSPAEAFPYRVTVAYSPKDACYVARVPALPHCAANGETPDAAVREALAAAESMLQVMRQNGDALPPPEWVRASG